MSLCVEEPDFGIEQPVGVAAVWRFGELDVYVLEVAQVEQGCICAVSVARAERLSVEKEESPVYHSRLESHRLIVQIGVFGGPVAERHCRDGGVEVAVAVARSRRVGVDENSVEMINV